MLEFFLKQGLSTELSELMVTLLDSFREISEAIKVESTGKVGSKNAFGEEQAAMDVRAENIVSEHLKGCPFVAAYGSEELDELQEAHEEGQFSVFYDPLDGSSLLDVNQSVGTIVGVYEGTDVMGLTARSQVAALYALYGPRTTVVLTFGKGTFAFKLVDGVWEFERELKLDSEKKYFAPGNLRATKERQDYFDLVSNLMLEQYTLRYSGGMVPDINHMLFKGAGVFMYPGMPSKPMGKLRLLFECGPMAFIVEQAGGSASNGDCPILDLEIESLTQTTPIFIGGKAEVQRAQETLN